MEQKRDETLAAGRSSQPAAETWCWVVPLILFMVVPMVAERFGVVPRSQLTFPGQAPPGSDVAWLVVVAAQALLAGGLLWACRHEYLGSLPWRVSLWTLPVGLAGLALWVGVCELNLEAWLWSWWPWRSPDEGARPSVNPAESFPDWGPYLLFLAARFSVLVVVVPVAEELLLRGFFLRMLQSDRWWELPMRDLTWTAVGVSAVYGVLTHPNEAVAALLWFAAVTVWVRWTDRFWDGVLIHAVTNASLGVYVMTFEQWHLW